MNQPRRYHLQEAVGRGSFGTVYRATMDAESGFSKEVAVKILKPEVAAEPEMTRRLRDEARVLGLLRHRAILQVDGLVFIEGRWAVVMEFIEGISLAEATGQARMPLGVSLEIVAEIASALHAAFNQPGPDGRPLRLIHRDIKPANIRITPAGTVKVLDFGIARADFDARESETASLVMGSFGYMAPERLDSIDGPEGDLYALGVVLYEMVVGERLGKTSSNPMRHGSFRQAAVRRFERVVGVEGFEAARLVERLLDYDVTARPDARELEIACRRLARTLHEETLAEWAARIVPFLMASAADGQQELSGMTLAESRPPRGAGEEPTPGASTPEASTPDFDLAAQTFPLEVMPEHVRNTRALPPPLPPEPEPAPWRRWVWGLSLLLLLITVASALIALRPVQRGGTTQHPVLPKAPEAPKVVALPPEASPEPAPTTRAPEERHTLVFDLEAILDELEAEQAPATPVVRAPPMGRVRVAPDDVQVELHGPAGRFSPGPVPPGTYEVRARFGDAQPVTAGRVQVIEGATVTLNCNSLFMRCSLSE